MAGGRRYDERVRDLLDDARAAADERDWTAVRGLATAALALAPDSAVARELLEDADAAEPASGERRQLTVMFCDVVGSTGMSQQRDPELVREVLRSYQVACDRVVRRYEGHVARYIGDGILAYFGHPVPHEDDARRGVQAGLDLLEALQPVVEEAASRHDLELRIRVAVHTGVVVRSDMGSPTNPDRDAIVGETPNVAARLQDHAQPGSLIVSHATYELVRPWFLVRPLGAIELRGIEGAVTAYEVVEATGEEGRVHAHADLSPFVGRDDERAVLADAWQEVAAGGSRVVALSGQPGVGKSRLADVLRRRVEADDGTALVTGCSSYHGATALHPVRRLLERAARIDPHQDPTVAMPRLWSAMEAVGQADAMPVVADLLGLPPTSWCPAPELEGAKLREALLASLERWVEASAARHPLLLILEDLQWADPTTMELLGRVVRRRVPGLLLLLTVRDDAKVPWSSADVVTLDRLSSDDLADLARRLPEGRALPPDDLARVIERSDGIPLFLEELLHTSALAHGDDGRPAASAIPAALRDLLLARFAAPGVDLRLAQVIATIGSEVAAPLLATVSSLSPSDLQDQLAALVDAGILTVVPGEPVAYRFRHHLLEELAYDTQLLANRRQVHAAVADALLAGGPAESAAGPAVLARHLEEAGRPEAAVVALVEAAESAHALGASVEAAALLERAFTLLESVDPARRNELEFQARSARGVQASSVLGFAAPQAVEDFAVCLDLIEAMQPDGYLDDELPGGGTREHLAWEGSGLWATFLIQGRLAEAEQINVSLTAQLKDTNPMHDYFGSTRAFIDFFRGDYTNVTPGLIRSRELLEQIEMSPRISVPSDPLVTNLAHLSYAYAVQGRFDLAREVSDDALGRTPDLPYPRGPFSHCYAGTMRAAVEVMAGEVEEGRRWGAVSGEIAERHGFTFWTIVAGYHEAVTALRLGDEGAGPRTLAMIGLLRSLGVLVWLPSFYASVSEVHLARGEVDEAEAVLRDAQAVVEETGSRFWSAELARQEGEVLLARGDASGCDRLLAAVALAVEQGATLHELWARTSRCAHVDDDAERAALAALVARFDPDLADVARARTVLAGAAP